jgi:hypothetical protein
MARPPCARCRGCWLREEAARPARSVACVLRGRGRPKVCPSPVAAVANTPKYKQHLLPAPSGCDRVEELSLACDETDPKQAAKQEGRGGGGKQRKKRKGARPSQSMIQTTTHQQRQAAPTYPPPAPRRSGFQLEVCWMAVPWFVPQPRLQVADQWLRSGSEGRRRGQAPRAGGGIHRAVVSEVVARAPAAGRSVAQPDRPRSQCQ